MSGVNIFPLLDFSVILLMNGTSVRCVLAHDWLGCPRGVASLVGIPFGGPTAVHNQFRGSRSSQRNHEKNCLRDRFFGDALRDGNRRQCPTTEKLWPPKGETCFYSSKACFFCYFNGLVYLFFRVSFYATVLKKAIADLDIWKMSIETSVFFLRLKCRQVKAVSVWFRSSTVG